MTMSPGMSPQWVTFVAQSLKHCATGRHSFLCSADGWINLTQSHHTWNFTSSAEQLGPYVYITTATWANSLVQIHYATFLTTAAADFMHNLCMPFLKSKSHYLNDLRSRKQTQGTHQQRVFKFPQLPGGGHLQHGYTLRRLTGRGGRSPWRNHSLQVWLKYFKGFQIYRGSKFPFSHWLCWSSLQQCCRYRAACDIMGLGGALPFSFGP